MRNANEDTVLELADHLPSEADEALLDLATGVKPQVAQPVTAGDDPFDHPDAQRRFRIMNNQEELERALEYPATNLSRDTFRHFGSMAIPKSSKI